MTRLTRGKISVFLNEVQAATSGADPEKLTVESNVTEAPTGFL